MNRYFIAVYAQSSFVPAAQNRSYVGIPSHIWLVLTIGFALVSLFLLVRHLLYRRQIRAICRQLEFLQTHETNKRIQTDLADREILELAELLNIIYDNHTRQKLELTNKDRRMKDALTSISHDIRTPLTALKGYFHLLLSEESADRKLSYAAVMQSKMQELSTLLEELFTYTKLQNEEYTLEMKEHNITKLVLEVLFSFYEEFRACGITPEIHADETPLFLLCSDIAVRRILSNIIRNALIHGNGTIVLTYRTSHNAVVFSCENSVAKPESIDMEQIFDRFYKADHARSHQSSGLGLPIARELARRSGGILEASLVEHMFCVAFKLPVLHDFDETDRQAAQR